jgi:16S rRNA (guanine966-N2)-methyltransferase
MTARGRGAGVSAGRVIAGTARGIRLVGPGDATRPLGDRVKQSLFAILELRLRASVFLDLYAGSGAAGIEALSRGAARAILVDVDLRAIQAIGRNLDATGLAERGVVIRQQAAAWLAVAQRRELEGGPAAVVFLDPPYDAPAELERSLAAIENAGRGGILAEDGIVVAKHSRRTEPAPTRLLRSVRQERFGDTVLAFFRWAEEVDP